MHQVNRIREYLEAVCQQIRWKKARPIVMEELSHHIEDQTTAYIEDGIDPQSAADKAITQMGDPVAVGGQLDRIHRPRPDWVLLSLIAIMLGVGLVAQYAAIPASFAIPSFAKQIIWAGIACLVMVAAYFTDFTIIGKYPLLIFFTLCGVAVALYLYGSPVAGNYYAIIYPLLLVPTAYSGVVCSMRNRGYRGIALCMALLMIPGFLAIRMNASVLLLFGVCYVILTSAICKGWFQVSKKRAVLLLYASTMSTMAVLMLILPKNVVFYLRWEGFYHRILMSLQPSRDPMGGGYATSLMHQLLSHSQLAGKGAPLERFNVSAGQFPFWHSAHTDYLLIYLTYNFGWITAIGIVVLLTLFIVRGFIQCWKQQSTLGFLTSLAIISTFTIQVIVYIAFNAGFTVLPPLSLPLLSYGGRALVVNMLLMGLLLSIFRTGSIMRDQAPGIPSQSNRFIEYNKGRLVINLTKKPAE